MSKFVRLTISRILAGLGLADRDDDRPQGGLRQPVLIPIRVEERRR
jgi:hypothetical protein